MTCESAVANVDAVSKSRYGRMRAGFTKGRNLIVIGEVRVDYETEIPGKVNWCQTHIRSKWKLVSWWNW